MRAWSLRVLGSAVVVLAVACGSSRPPDNVGTGDAGDDADASLLGEPLSAACADWFDALSGASSGGCGFGIPADFVTHEKERFIQLCQGAFTLPGVHTTAADVEACARALKAEGCRSEQNPAECLFSTGSAAVGAECTYDLQCATGVCAGAVSANSGADGGGADGGGACSTCISPVPDGQPCTGLGSSRCAPGSVCVVSSPPRSARQSSTATSAPPAVGARTA